MGPILRATVQAAAISAVSNFFGQYLDCWFKSKSFEFNVLDLIRFLVLHFITAPLNYKWQELLESTFPAYDKPSEKSIILGDRDVEKHFIGADAEEENGLQTSSPRLNWKNTITKWLIDSITLGAVMNTSAFFIIMGILKGQSASKIAHNINTKMLIIIVNGWKVWPLASIISFSFIPVRNRIQFFSCIGLGWNVYGSIIAQNL